MTTDAPEPNALTEHAARNHEMWEGYSDEYQERHGQHLADSGGAAWGTYQYPEAELQILGDVAGKDVLEFGAALPNGRSRWRNVAPGWSGSTSRRASSTTPAC